MSTQLVPFAGWILIIAGALIGIGGILSAMLRIRSQYSSAMPGRGSLYISTALTTLVQFWPAWLATIVGVVLLLAFQK